MAAVLLKMARATASVAFTKNFFCFIVVLLVNDLKKSPPPGGEGLLVIFFEYLHAFFQLGVLMVLYKRGAYTQTFLM